MQTPLAIGPISEYYRSEPVRARVREYCGLDEGADSRCVFLCGLFPEESAVADWGSAPRDPVNALERLFDLGADISRSLWETNGLLFCLDIDYINLDAPGEAFTHPVETFHKLESVFQRTTDVLTGLSIPFLSIVTGEGYHFVARVPADHASFDELASLAPAPPPWLTDHETRVPLWMRERISERTARAYSGLGMALEFLAHRILRDARKATIPWVLNGTPVGTGLVGRECVSLDLSAAGDPLEIRHSRVAYGAYQKHRWRPDLVGWRVASEVPPLIALPRAKGESLLDFLDRGRGREHAIGLAATRAATPPSAGDGMLHLLSEYRRDPLASFHRDFYSERAHPPERWASTYDRLDPRTLPACVGNSLAYPNDLLLRPAYLQNLTRTLLARGWHPRHIAGLVRSRYERDFGWGNRWKQMHAETHADFYVRAFAGMVRTGVDSMVDFNCTSTREKGMCPGGICGHDLRDERALLGRRFS